MWEKDRSSPEAIHIVGGMWCKNSLKDVAWHGFSRELSFVGFFPFLCFCVKRGQRPKTLVLKL